MLPGLEFPERARARACATIWFDSDGFNRFRGTGWMKEPCASCDEREKDLGGCRCQAYLLAQDADAADPVCGKSPHHALVTAPVELAQAPRTTEFPLVFRDPANSRARSAAVR